MTAREDIAAAASTVTGIDVSPYYRAVSGAGQGYVEWLRTEWPNKLGGEAYWGVVIGLPTDLAAAQRWIDLNQRTIVTALGPRGENELTVTQVRPEIVLSQDNQAQRVLVIEGHREDDEE